MQLPQEVTDKLQEIFMPYASKRRKELMDGDRRLVHYTTAENAIKIIRSKSIWLRNTRGMQDYSEVEHGYAQLRNYFQDKESLEKFNKALDGCNKNLGMDTIQLFDQWWSNTKANTYISCFSEHSSKEDNNGRLSMWRTFGRNTAGVAIVLKPPSPYSSIPLKVMLSPVAYYSAHELKEEFDEIIKNIGENQDLLKNLTREHVLGLAYMTLVMAAVSLKHEGFAEECEWRLIYLPEQLGSEYIKAQTETIDGIPQRIYKLELKNYPEKEISGIEIPDLLDRVIIGPSQYASSIYDSLVNELQEAQVPNAHERIFISWIPLRG